MKSRLKRMDAKCRFSSWIYYDTWGRKITTIAPTKDYKVQLGDLAPGAYFIKVLLTNQESKTIKIIKVGT
ncbi:MAG: T9SS type A sorting domain-containing protein [Cytophagales bacterium]|nr:T9SS type A sorting domain-containing protein [Cytophagales bacterium]